MAGHGQVGTVDLKQKAGLVDGVVLLLHHIGQLRQIGPPRWGSLVQQEVGDTEVQKQVAQVFLKRLKEDIQLGSDVTFFYAAELTGEDPSPSLDNPYNTRLYKGLPPGPIGTVTRGSLNAVANPAKGDFLFFVAGDDGNTYFSKTLEEHNANVKKHCIELCKLP